MARQAGKLQVAIVMGSDSDLTVVDRCTETLDELCLGYEMRVLSAHRTPNELARYVEGLERRGAKVVIAAAGLSAALPGTVAAHTTLPVIGIPVCASTLGGVDALMSISQMPPGVPVAAVTIGSPGATNAALLAARILALGSKTIAKRLKAYISRRKKRVLAADRRLQKR